MSRVRCQRPTKRAPHAVLALAALGCLLPACRKATPPAPPPTKQATPSQWEVSKKSPLLYTYVKSDGSFATTNKASDVPTDVRRLVRVVDPSKPLENAQDASRVYVVDLSRLIAAGKTKAHAISRAAFETGALAQLPPGDSSPMAGPHGPPLPELTGGPDAGQPGALGPPVVTVYGAPWCGACKAAKEYLASRHIPYAYKDIENDPAAARELQAKAEKMGIPTDRIPILDVRGRLLVGFDPARLNAMLGNST